MKHELSLDGFAYRLRPIGDADAAMVVELRSNPELNQYLNPSSDRVADQLAWLANYYQREGDYYFVVERRSDGEAVGVISIYDVDARAGSAEWGRWVLRPGTLAAVESAWLVYRMAFERLGLQTVYCRTIAENVKVVSFHDSCGVIQRRVLPAQVELRGRRRDVVEHRVDRAEWPSLAARLERLARFSLRQRAPASVVSVPATFEFHHVGYATGSVDKERMVFEALGWCAERGPFVDPAQGIRGQFLVGLGPRIELLENLPESDTLTPWIKAGIKMYHLAYRVGDLAAAVAWAQSHRGRVIVPPVAAVAFEGRSISFVMFRNGFMLEFIEAPTA